MSEIQDAAQIIRVTFEGAEIILKLGGNGWNFVKEVCAVFRKAIEQEKLAGKTSVKQLLKMGGDLQVFKFRTEQMAEVKKLADKYGILYSILPDLNKSDGKSEILFHSQAAPRIQAIMEKLQNAEIVTMDDYLGNAEPEELEKLVEEAEKKPEIPDEKEYRLVAQEFAKNPHCKVSDIRSRLNMTWMEIWPVVKHMEQNQLLKSEKDGIVSMKMGVEEFREFMDSAQWKQWFGEKEADGRGDKAETEDKKIEEIKRIQKESKSNPNINAITIDRKLVMEETEKHLKTRIPYKKDEYIWINKSEITWINGNKTIFAGLEKEKTYTVLDSENKPVRTVSGQKLYEQSYDAVRRNQARREQEKIRNRKDKEYITAQRTLENSRNALRGKGGR